MALRVVIYVNCGTTEAGRLEGAVPDGAKVEDVVMFGHWADNGIDEGAVGRDEEGDEDAAGRDEEVDEDTVGRDEEVDWRKVEPADDEDDLPAEPPVEYGIGPEYGFWESGAKKRCKRRVIVIHLLFFFLKKKKGIHTFWCTFSVEISGLK